MIYFMQEDNLIYRVWSYNHGMGDMADYKIVSVEQFVQIKMVCQLLEIELMEIHYVDPSFA